MARFNYDYDVTALSDDELALELGRVGRSYINLVDEAITAYRHADYWDQFPTGYSADDDYASYSDLLWRIEQQHNTLVNELKRRARPGFRAA